MLEKTVQLHIFPVKYFVWKLLDLLCSCG